MDSLRVAGAHHVHAVAEDDFTLSLPAHNAKVLIILVLSLGAALRVGRLHNI